MRLRFRFSPSVLLAGAGVALLAAASTQWLWGNYREREDRLEFVRQLSAPAPPVSAFEKPEPPVALGVLRIKRLGVEVLIRPGANHATLAEGAGWIPGTALPGRSGNVGIAAHRDTFFRELQDIRIGDEITLLTTAGERTFRVEGTRIVDPSQTDVLAPTLRDTVTLVTCYPFDFVGSAPQRFIVRATLVPVKPGKLTRES